MARTVYQGILCLFIGFFYVIRTVCLKATESQIQGDAPFFRLGIFVKGRGACDCTQGLGQRCFSTEKIFRSFIQHILMNFNHYHYQPVYVSKNSNIEIQNRASLFIHCSYQSICGNDLQNTIIIKMAIVNYLQLISVSIFETLK